MLYFIFLNLFDYRVPFLERRAFSTHYMFSRVIGDKGSENKNWLSAF